MRAKARSDKAAWSTTEPLRRLPIRDASAPRVDETTLVLTAARIGEDDGGFGAFDLVTAFWLGLAAALLIVGYVVRFAEVPQPLGVFLFERRSVLALIGVNMVFAAAICYLVVGDGVSKLRRLGLIVVVAVMALGASAVASADNIQIEGSRRRHCWTPAAAS